jgi:hypothetical protein
MEVSVDRLKARLENAVGEEEFNVEIVLEKAVCALGYESARLSQQLPQSIHSSLP